MTEKKKKNLRVKKPVAHDATLSRRLLSYFIDWYVGGLATSFPIAMISLKMYGNMLHQDVVNFTQPYGLIGGILGLVGAFLYFVIVPAFVWKGQTFGKHLCKIKIIKEDDREVNFSALFMRQIVGILILEGGLITASSLLHQIFTIVTGINVITQLMYVGLAISAVSALMVLFFGHHRAIHDYLAKTKVVMCA